jgi:AcrR family transcriptional regulator
MSIVDGPAPQPAPDTDHERRRRQILEHAAEVFAERGFVAGTTKEIAGRVGLSQPAIYHYVGSKEALLQEIALQVDRDMREAMEKGLQAGDSPASQLEGIVRAFTAAVVANRLTFTVYYKELHLLQEDIRRAIAEDERRFVGQVAGVMRRLQEDGTLPADRSALVLAEAVIGMVSWVHRWYRPSGPLDADAIADHFLTIIGPGV